MSLPLSTSSLSLTPTLVRYLSQHKTEAIRHSCVLLQHRMWDEGQREMQSSEVPVNPRGTSDSEQQVDRRGLSPVAFSGLLHMKHCHAPAASLKPNTSKNLTSSRWSCTWSRSCSRNTKHKEPISWSACYVAFWDWKKGHGSRVASTQTWC